MPFVLTRVPLVAQEWTVAYPNNVEKDGSRVNHGPGAWHLFSPHVIVR
jgi:hypothetical protein